MRVLLIYSGYTCRNTHILSHLSFMTMLWLPSVIYISCDIACIICGNSDVMHHGYHTTLNEITDIVDMYFQKSKSHNENRLRANLKRSLKATINNCRI